MAKFKIYGDYGYTSECLLYDTDSRNEALLWAERYVNGGDLGGYSVIEVAWFADSGEYMTEFTHRSDDQDQAYFY